MDDPLFARNIRTKTYFGHNADICWFILLDPIQGRGQMLRLSQIVIFTCIVLLFSTIPFDSLLREEETVAEADVIDPENIGKSGSILTVGSGGPDKKVIMTTRSASPDDIEELKARAGVWQPGVDYNPIINGRGILS